MNGLLQVFTGTANSELAQRVCDELELKPGNAEVDRFPDGEVRVKLFKGGVTILGRRSPVSLYSEDLVTFEEDEGAYDQADAGGFIRLQGLRLGRRSS